TPNIPIDARWEQNGVTVGGGRELGNATNQLHEPLGLVIDDDQTVVIADWGNHRVIEWKMGDSHGSAVAGGHGEGNQLNQLNTPTDVLIDRETDSLIISDRGNQRIVQWSRSGPTKVEILLDNINCWGLAMDDQRYLYISETEKDEVRRYKIGDKNGTIVAGGHGKVTPNIPIDARWEHNGVTVGGGRELGNATNQLHEPHGLVIDDDQTVVIADWGNHRVIEWKMGDSHGSVVAGGHGEGNQLNQLNTPTDVLIDRETDSLIISDRGNQRIVQWSRSGPTKVEILLDNINCWGLAMDDQRYLYISETEHDEVRRYKIGDKNGTIVAGGHGKGNGLNQLNEPTYLFVDQQQTVYVSDNANHRVMKWNKNAQEGVVVAGSLGCRTALTKLSYPKGLFIDTFGTLYMADPGNHRVMRWLVGAKQGTVIVGEKGEEEEANQLNFPMALSFDRHGNLYVVDRKNHRVQRFSIR
ncbi:unnamed protein product, partial [Rotaria sp. Silwood1]